jgi:FtsP/CotA-like multicopper oxidase with cupredoxin domain
MYYRFHKFPHTLSLYFFAGALVLPLMSYGANADDLREPPIFRSENKVLDLLMVATSRPVTDIGFPAPQRTRELHPTAWVYEVCRRVTAPTPTQCPPGSAAPYGGVRLALSPGDSLKIRLINKLPVLDPDKLTHSLDSGGENLFRNPTNLHTHGLAVPARPPSDDDPTLGDYIFVQIYNSANGKPTPEKTSHGHGSFIPDFADYRIDIPKQHPPGAYWFHPHVHGIALNQLSSGLSGILSIGSAGEYVQDSALKQPFPEHAVRHLVLKDMQVLAKGKIKFHHGEGKTIGKDVSDGEVLNQEDPAFCNQRPSEQRHGFCPGVDNSAANDGNLDNNYLGGRWYFTINGQQYPIIPVNNREGELWRLTNASGSASYNLQLIDDATGTPLTMQLISIDGVSLPSASGAAPGAFSPQRFRLTPCPPSSTTGSVPVCVDQFTMMPSSRVEVWVTPRRNAAGGPATTAKRSTATFKSIGLTTGPAGDSWPEIDLAKVIFTPPAADHVSAVEFRETRTIANSVAKATLSAECDPPLSAGHRRRIFFGLADTSNQSSFGLGYEEIDENGDVVSMRDVMSFNPTTNVICLPLGPDATVRETWELVNLATELHNFHIHQARFSLVPSAPAAVKGTLPPTMDNVPLPIATPQITDVANNQNGYCTMAQWHQKQCLSEPVTVDISFSQPGTFVFHCHILEHEDGGMMARIQVGSARN